LLGLAQIQTMATRLALEMATLTTSGQVTMPS